MKDYEERLVEAIIACTPIRTAASATEFISLLRKSGVRIEMSDAPLLESTLINVPVTGEV